MKITIKSILKENVNDREEEAYQKFLKGVAKRIKPPYIKNMVSYGVPELDWHEVFDEIFGVGVYVYTNSSNTEYQVIDHIYNNVLYAEDVQLYVGDEPLYVGWRRYEYNSNHCPLEWTYMGVSDNTFAKREFNDSGEIIYWEDENGVGLDKRNKKEDGE